MNPEQNIKYICKKYFIREAYIFGSEISGFKHPGSDLDIGIIFKNGIPETEKIIKIYGDIYSDLSMVFPEEEIDLVFIEEAPLHFQFKVLTEGRQIYLTDIEQSYNYKENIINLYLDWKYFIDEFYKGMLETPSF